MYATKEKIVTDNYLVQLAMLKNVIEVKNVSGVVHQLVQVSHFLVPL